MSTLWSDEDFIRRAVLERQEWTFPALASLIFFSFFLPRSVWRSVFVLVPTLWLTFGQVLWAYDGTPWAKEETDHEEQTAFLFLTLVVLDYFLVDHLKGEEKRYYGRSKDKGIVEGDCNTLLSRFKWAIRVLSTWRGIGFERRVKGVPPWPEMSKWEAVGYKVHRCLIATVRKYLMLYIIGHASTLRGVDDRVRSNTGTVLLCWSAMASVWNAMAQLHDGAAALTIAIGLCEPWEWPPVFGSLSEAWSVRRTWGQTYHQLLRRQFENVTLPLSRWLNLPKGSLESRYFQLYCGFAVSMVIHEWLAFATKGHDNGEFVFFMSQPIAITVEDLVQWLWRTSASKPRGDRLLGMEKVIGWTWVFLWFSWSSTLFCPNIMYMFDWHPLVGVGAEHAMFLLEA